MRTSRKILLALVLTLVVAAVMSVCAFAFDINTDLPQGVTNEDAKWKASGYSDVDTEEGWYMIASGDLDFSTPDGGFPTFASLNGSRFYWNKTTGEAVWLVISSNMSGDSGEESVFSVKNPTTSAKQKFYAYASCFVDVANTTGNTFKTGFASGQTEIAQYVTQNATKYPIYNRYITAGTASKQWSNVYVTADAYAAFVAYKAELGYAEEDAAVSDTAHQDLLVEWAYNNIAGYKNARNCQEAGALYRMAWIFNELANNGYVFKTIEIRAAKGVTPYFGTVGLVSKLIEAKTILFDSKINDLRLTNATRGLFIGNKALRTLAHVTYDAEMTGAYTGNVTEGVVNLSGFAKVTPYTPSNVTYFFSEILQEAGMTDVVWFNSIKSGDTEYAGLIDYRALYGATSLKTLTLTAPLTSIARQGLRDCKALTTIDLRGGVAEDATVDSEAFHSVKQEITVYVYSDADLARAQTLFASWSNITVVNNSAAKGAIIADGYSIRIDDTSALYKGPALRAEFTLLKEKVDEVKTKEGYDLADYGVVVFSEATFNTYGSLDALLAAIADGLDENEQKKIKMVSAVNGPYVSVNAKGDKTFAAAITGIPELNYDSAVYTYAYATWSNGTDTKYTYITYTSTRVTGKQAHSLYDATVFAFRNGVVNSQNFKMSTEVELWDILKKGAFSIANGEQKAFSTLVTVTPKYEFDADNKFTYLDLPLHAWRFYKSSATASPAWNSYAHSLEETSSTNIVWSILRDGNDLVVVYRRADGIADDAVATVPDIRDRAYSGYAPYSSNYLAPASDSTLLVEGELVYGTSSTNGFCKTQNAYSPILSDANEAKITALVLDYGVNNITGGAFENTTVSTLATIVYPEGITTGGKFLNYNYFVENVIYASDNKTSITEETQADGFGAIADLSGLSGFSLSYAFSDARKVENVILPKSISNWSGLEEGFKYAYAIKRVWAVGADVPADGTIDLTGASALRSFAKNCFTDTSRNAAIKAPTIILPASFIGVNSYAYIVKEADPCTQIFGKDMSFTVKLNDIKALTTVEKVSDDWSLMAFYDNMQALLAAGSLTSDRADNLNKLTFVCEVNGETKSMTIAEWRTYLVAQGLYTPAA